MGEFSALDTVASLAIAEGLEVARDQSVASMTTYKVGGPVSVLVTVADGDELVKLASIVASVTREGSDVDTLVIGNGSNLLVADAGATVVAIRLGAGFESIELNGSLLTAGGAARLPVVARRSVALGLTGFEWAVGVPGSIGGAVRMNAGGHGSDMASCVASVRVLDLQTGQDTTMPVADCEFSYRRSRFGSHEVVLSATLALSTATETAAGERELSEIVSWRRANQPGGQNAGSVFTNPEGDSAGRLIDAAGCKGLRVGSAEVSTKHANFIQADPGGSADDVAAVMGAVAEAVRSAHGVSLHPETVMVGFSAAVRQRAGVRS